MQSPNEETSPEGVHSVPKAQLTPIAKILTGLLVLFSIFLLVSRVTPAANHTTKKQITPVRTIKKEIQPQIAVNHKAQNNPQTQKITINTLTLAIPKNWTTVKTIGDTQNYQMAIRPQGEEDVPIVLDVYTKVQEPFNQFVSEQAQRMYTSPAKETVGNMIHLSKNGEESYFFARENDYFILSTVTGSEQIHSVYENLIKQL